MREWNLCTASGEIDAAERLAMRKVEVRATSDSDDQTVTILAKLKVPRI